MYILPFILTSSATARWKYLPIHTAVDYNNRIHRASTKTEKSYFLPPSVPPSLVPTLELLYLVLVLRELLVDVVLALLRHDLRRRHRYRARHRYAAGLKHSMAVNDATEEVKAIHGKKLKVNQNQENQRALGALVHVGLEAVLTGSC